MAVGSLIVFVALLAAMAILMSRLWQDQSVIPVLKNQPRMAIAPGSTVAASPGAGPSVAVARVAAPRGGGLVLEKTPVATVDAAAGVGVAAARPVAATPTEPPASTPSPAPVASPEPEAAPVNEPQPAAQAPVVADVGGGPRRTGSGGSVPPRTAGGPGRIPGSASFEIEDGGEYAFTASFRVEPTAFREPDAENALLRFSSDAGAPPSFALQLWEVPEEDWYPSSIGQGLWSSGEAMGGERFLSPLSAGEWHELAIDFRASGEEDGFYVVFVDGTPVDARSGVSLIAAGASANELGIGLFREGAAVEGSSEMKIAAARLSERANPALP